MKILRFHDENLPVVERETDRDGKCVHTPPDDGKLNWLGETAFKQLVVAARERDGAVEHVASYTQMLHRSRNGNQKLIPGLAVFAGTIVLALSLVVTRRRLEARHEA